MSLLSRVSTIILDEKATTSLGNTFNNLLGSAEAGSEGVLNIATKFKETTEVDLTNQFTIGFNAAKAAVSTRL